MDKKFRLFQSSNRIFATPLKVIALLAIVVLVTGFALQLNQKTALAAPPEWRDDFDGDLAPAWFWVNQNPDMWGLEDGYLRIDTSSSPTSGQNLLLRPIDKGNFVIETYLGFEPNANFQIAGLVVYQDEENFLQFGRAYCDIEGACVGNGIYFDHAENGTGIGGNYATAVDNSNEAYLRLARKGLTITAYYSEDGQNWQWIGEHTIPPSFQINGVGLTSSQDFDGAGNSAYFDYFLLKAPITASAPFIGNWQAVDLDGSDIHLTVAGPPNGPFQIVSTDSYISWCDGGPGIMRGTGYRDENNPNLFEADLHLECFTIEKPLDLHLAFRYHPATNTLSNLYDPGQITIWYRPGQQQESAMPLALRVNYGNDDWVESFYGEGQMASIMVTDGGGDVKATAGVIIEPKDFWGGEIGFQTQWSDWFDAEGNRMGYPPDIQPYDWVYGWVDNGAVAQVQMGDITGEIDLNADSIVGTVNAPWFSDQVEVECLPWGAPKPIDNVTYGLVWPDNSETYSCSWSGEWNILPNQDVGVGYLGPDGHWVANVFYASAPQIIASESGDWFWTTGFNPGQLDLFIYESSDMVTLLWQGNRDADESGFVSVGYEDHGQNLVEGNYLVVSDGVNHKELVLLQTTITVFDTIHDVMAGIAPAGSEVWAAAGPNEWQERIFVEADPTSGEWLADFASIGFDITEDMRPWSFSHVYDGDGDANEGSTPPSPEIRAWLGNQRVEGYGWPIDDEVSIEIYDPVSEDTYSDSQVVVEVEYGSLVVYNLDGWELQPGQVITMTGSMTVKSHEILPVSITSVDTEQSVIEGTASSEGRIILCIYDGGCDPPTELFADPSGNWSMDYGEDINIMHGMDATEFDDDGDGTSFDWFPQQIFLRPGCGGSYTAQAGFPLELQYGSWVAIGEERAQQNAEHLTVDLTLGGMPIIGVQQPVVPAAEIPCGNPPEDAFGTFYVAYVGPLSLGTSYIATVTWTFDDEVTDGYDVDGDGVLDTYGPGWIATREFEIIVE